MNNLEFINLNPTFLYYYTILLLIGTTIIYLTYRFWKFLLPKEELNIFVANAPVVGSKKCDIDDNLDT